MSCRCSTSRRHSSAAWSPPSTTSHRSATQWLLGSHAKNNEDKRQGPLQVFKVYPVKYLLDFNSWNFGLVPTSLNFLCPDEWWIVWLSKCGVETLHRVQLYWWMCTAHVCMYNSVYLQCRQMGRCLSVLHSRLKKSFNVDRTGWITGLVRVLKILEKLLFQCAVFKVGG